MAFITDSSFVAVCKNNEIVVFEQYYDIFTQQLYLELMGKISNFELATDQIDSVKIYYDEILVIKSKDNKFYWLNLAGENGLNEINLKENNLKNCDWNQ